MGTTWTLACPLDTASPTIAHSASACFLGIGEGGGGSTLLLVELLLASGASTLVTTLTTMVCVSVMLAFAPADAPASASAWDEPARSRRLTAYAQAALASTARMAASRLTSEPIDTSRSAVPMPKSGLSGPPSAP